MVIYLTNILSLVIWKKIYDFKEDKTTKKIVLFGIFLQFIIIEGFRSFSIGADTQDYIEYYNIMKNMNPSFVELIINPPMNFELGYMILMKVSVIFGFSDRIFLLLVTIILNALFFRFIYKRSIDPIFSIWLFICTEYFTLSFTMLRQMIAIGCVLNAYLFIEEKRLKSFLLTLIVAVSFHKTAICFLPIYFILNKEEFIKEPNTEKINMFYQRYKLQIWLFATFFILLIIPIVFELFYKLFYSYYNLENQSFNFPTLAILILGILLMSYFFEKKYHIYEKEYFNIQFFVLCAFLLQLATFRYLYLFRIALYFYIFVIILIPEMLKYVQNSKVQGVLRWCTMILSFIQYILFSMNVYNLIPYTWG